MSAIPSWARVGAKVVCVDDSCRPGRLWLTYTPIVAERIYVIAGVGPSWLGGDEPVLFLDGCPNSTFGVGDDGWRVSRFRPLITQEDDIATHFSALLDVREPVGA